MNDKKVIDKFSRIIAIVALIISFISMLFPIIQYYRDNEEIIKLKIEGKDDFHIEVKKGFVDDFVNGKYDKFNIDEGFNVYIPKKISLYNLSQKPIITERDMFFDGDRQLEIRDELKSEFVHERIEPFDVISHTVSIRYELNDDQREYIFNELKNSFDENTLEFMSVSIEATYYNREYCWPFNTWSAIYTGLQKYYQANDVTYEYEYVLETVKKKYTKPFTFKPFQLEEDNND